MPRETGQHTLDKLRILRQYLPVYLQATKEAIERVYVDAFAGPGRNRIRETNGVVDGSPLIALDATAKNGTRFDRYIFIELNRDTAHELETVLAERVHDRRIQVIRGDVNVNCQESFEPSTSAVLRSCSLTLMASSQHGERSRT
jgi:three-Cys-motif partner protein